MIKPVIPENDKDRISVLEKYQVLDTLPEKEFDDLTKIASQICKTPIALVSLIDENRQWFKSRNGLDATETPRELAFCAHAINNSDEILVVNNALEDERFHDNPLVVDAPNVVFYAGAPLVDEDGYALGTLCVIDNMPRVITEDQKTSLRALADHVMVLFKLRKQNFELIKKQAEVDESKLKVEQRNQELQQFVYVASHDLQEPLRTISSMVDVISENLEGSIDDETAECIDFMNSANLRMKNLISSLLEHSRIGNSGSFIDNDFNQIVADVISNLSLLIKESDAKIEVKNNLPSLMSESSSISRLFQNLIINAIKYKSNDKSPIIEISCEELKTEFVFKVTDNGLGVKEEFFDRIFVIFQRLKNENGVDGVGIGLANCKKIVNLHGGRIWVESKLNKGSDFYFTISKNNK